MSITIQRATLQNAKEIGELFNNYRVFYQQASDVKASTAFIAERLSNGESIIFYASNEQGHVLGFTQLYPTFSSISAKKSLVLNDLFVAANTRRLGVARKLMDAAKDFALNAEINGLSLETALDNVNAQALYQSLGYQKETGFYNYYLDLTKP
ncbi:GNAT family N-acetyltransferase [Gammaproteobacteria bacterium AS21]